VKCATAKNALMGTVDDEIGRTFNDLETVKRVFDVARYCTAEQLSDRPKMNEVSRLLQSLVPNADDVNHPPRLLNMLRSHSQ
ncbi:hypothetical protein MKX03_015758, partial [Papaver bracteatum]